jgi:TolA-binding protein
MGRPETLKWWSLSLLLVMLAAGCATRRDVTTIDTRLSEIEMRESEERRRRDEITRSREANEQALRQMSASLRAQIDELREEVRSLSGRLEEMEHSVRQKPGGAESTDKPREDRLARMEDASNQYAQRLARIEEQLKIEPAGTAAKAESKIRPEAAAKVPSEEDLYNRARQALEQGNTGQARRGYEELIQRYPNSANADAAQFWIG